MTTKATTPETEPRQALLDKYVEMDALDGVARSIAEFAWDGRLGQRLPVMEADPEDVAITFKDTSLGEMFLGLWPDDDDCDSADYYEAAARAARRQSDIFAMLAGPFGQERLIRLAIEQGEHAERMATEAHRRRGAHDDQ